MALSHVRNSDTAEKRHLELVMAMVNVLTDY